jgi:hypothetical protein
MGNEAWDAIKRLTDPEVALTIAFLTGHAVGMGATIGKERDVEPTLRSLIPRNVIVVPGEI